MVHKQPKLILGSRSPRRSQLLSEAGYSYTIRVEETSEDFEDSLPASEVAEMLACRKASALLHGLTDDEVLLTADSIVIADEKVYNKPAGEEEARTMLKELSGQVHTVATGVCLASSGKLESFTVTTKVGFDMLDEEEIQYYLKNYAPFDKAGSYGIQEWIGLCKVSHIDGSYSNVMGLPMREVYLALRKAGICPF